MTIDRILFTGALIAGAFLISACQAQSPDSDASADAASTAMEMTVYHDPNCGCCGKWTEHMRSHGFTVEEVPTQDMNTVKRKLGVPRNLPSCHTAMIGDYVIEGHVPAEDVRRLLAEQPDTRGLSV
ncbi:MAG TPA: DUF411 domain-containing protein, partial [Wenzhouxiangella sp.]|nr:DUF411 domain-containing protein [Wenzhouxiangella sp.]